MNYDQLGLKGIFRLWNLKYLRAEHHLRKLFGENKQVRPKCSFGGLSFTYSESVQTQHGSEELVFCGRKVYTCL